MAADDGVSVLEHTWPGQLFGLASFVAAHPATYEALATQPTRLVVFSDAAYVLLMDTVPGFGRALLGRGLSQWSPAPDDEYHLGFYAAQAVDLLDQLGIAQCHWLGTSMGGAIGLRGTQAGLAELAGLSRQTVNELLAQLVQQGRVRRAYGRLWLLPCDVGKKQSSVGKVA